MSFTRTFCVESGYGYNSLTLRVEVFCVVDVLERVRARVEVVLEYDGKVVLDSKGALVLSAIERFGSLLAASRALGIPYSTCWEIVKRVENVLGYRVVGRRRGVSGGACLTDVGRRLLELYEEACRRFGVRFRVLSIEHPPRTGALVVVGSNDIVLEHLLGVLKSEFSFDIEVFWCGSAGGLAAAMIGECDIAPTHLYDPATGEYNLPYLSRYWLEDRVVVVRGYMREVGIAYRPGLEIRGFRDAVEKGLRIVNRNLGSGTRVLVDYLLSKVAEEMGKSVDEVRNMLKGYWHEVRTHREVAEAIVRGDADFGVTLRHVAELYGLSFIPLKWEYFDFVIPAEKMCKEGVRKFTQLLSSEKLAKILERFRGYKVCDSTGKVIYAPKKK